MIPAISNGYLYGGGNLNNILFDRAELNMVSNLAGYLLRSNYELVGLYARILDHMGHWGLNKKEEYYHVIKETYERVFSIANALQPNVVLVSDHGCLSGEHTHKAYFGSGVPVEGKSILDVCSNIEAILVKNK